ncbi:MAG TPA: hypothetical protein DEQ02_05030 [Ruminococcaceae bacterium]|nr:hypothetical protein [Oscillospiraceae bacterium]
MRDIQSLDDIVPKKLPYDLDSAMGEAMRDIAILADKAGKKLAVESYGCDESPRGLLDKAILLRVLENVVSNALRYAEEKIEISFCVKDGMLSVTVQDDGSGFSKQALKSACTPFFRESGKDGHMGLGLAICTVLCGKHGGKLTVKNSEDGGAAVKFELSVN